MDNEEDFDTINELRAKLEEEKNHSAFLEKLLRTLFGEGWNKLTIDDAKKWSGYEIMVRFSEGDFDMMIEIVSKFDTPLACRIRSRRHKCTPEAERKYDQGYGDGARDHSPERHEMGG